MRPTPNSSDAKSLDTAPLEESEINRLIAAARAETYRPSQTAPRATAEAFRPKSLLELARLSREADKSAALAVADEGVEIIEAGDGRSQFDDGDGWTQDATRGADASGFAPQAVSATPEPADTATSLLADDIFAGGSDPRLFADQGEAGQHRLPVSALGKETLSGEGQFTPDAEALEQIRSEAFAAGRAEAEAEAEARLTAATQMLEAAAHALLHPASDALSALRAEIADAVLRLASERAGLEIDILPSAFIERIEELADRIHGRATQPVLRLHPADIAVIAPLIANSDSLSAMRILASEDLSRGDVDLTVDGLRMSDRILGQPAARKGRRSAPKPTPDTR